MSKKPIILKYVPHGINENHFYPIYNTHIEYPNLIKFKNNLFKNKEYDFVVLWNSRNIRRKSTSDLLLAWKVFIDCLVENTSEEHASKCALILHTQKVDDNGTDLPAVKDMLFGNNKRYNVIFSDARLPTNEMNYLYNLSDVVTLISSNEGWGLSLTEAMMAGKPIIASVTGGMQDQMRFEDEEGNWINFTEEFGSNHRGKYQKCGDWALPVFPSNLSLIGSVPTPYIYDDRVSAEDVANQILFAYRQSTEQPEIWKLKGEKAREWVTSAESQMSANYMCKNIIEGIDKTLEIFKPREKYELIKVITPDQPKHFNKYPIAE